MSTKNLDLLQKIAGPTTIFSITPHDTNLLAQEATGIVFKTAGALRILDGNSNEVTIPSGVLAVGVIHRIRVKKVFSTNTTAGDIWGVA